MIIYSNTLYGMANELNTRGFDVIEDIEKALQSKAGVYVQGAEYKSYATTLRKVILELRKMVDQDLDVLIEYHIPWTRKRIDLMIVGKGGEKIKAFVMELKGWTHASVSRDKEIKSGTTYKITSHPSMQAKNYVEQLESQSNINYEFHINLTPMVLMPNYDENNTYRLIDKVLFEYENEGVSFFHKDNFQELGKVLNKEFTSKVSTDELELFNKVKRRPIKPFLSLEDIKEISLSPSQAATLERIVDIVTYKEEGAKKAILVKGAPGCGKTIVAINALLEFARLDKIAEIIAPGQEFRDAIKDKWKNSSWRHSIVGLDIREEFFFSRQWDVVIADEGHKMTKMGMTINNFIKMVFKHNDVLISFIDDYQIVRKDGAKLDDYINYFETHNATSENKIDYEVLELTESHRNGGDISYPDWVRSWLYDEKITDVEVGYKQTAFTSSNFDVKIFDKASDFVDDYEQNFDTSNSRLLSFWFLKPISMRNWNIDANGLPERNIKLGDKYFAWNINDMFIRDYFNKPLITSELKKMSEISFCDPDIKKPWWMIGYYHHVQGGEFDSVYVYIPSFVKWNKDANEIVFDVEDMLNQKLYTDGNGLWALGKKGSMEYLTRLEKNITFLKNRLYVLLTRGTKGVNIYCEDKDLNEYLKSKVRKPIN